MSTATNHNNNTSVQTLDELDRQIKQAEMIRQYLQVTNIDRNPLPSKPPSTPEPESAATPGKRKTKCVERNDCLLLRLRSSTIAIII